MSKMDYPDLCPVCGGQRAWVHDHKPDGTGLDDGPPLPRSVANANKRERVVAEWKDGATLRVLGERHGISHETVRAWTAKEIRDVGASRRPHSFS